MRHPPQRRSTGRSLIRTLPQVAGVWFIHRQVQSRSTDPSLFQILRRNMQIPYGL